MAKAKENKKAPKKESRAKKVADAKMKVRFLKSPAKFNLAYYVGEEAELNAALAEELVETNHCEIVK